MNNSSLKSITVKRIPPKLYQRLKKTAAANHRSLNGEILFQLESSLMPPRQDPKKIIARLQEMQNQLRLPPLTEKILKQARAGRR